MNDRDYDTWKLDYPSHWDKDTFTCDSCEEEFSLDRIGRENAVVTICTTCNDTDKELL